MMPDTAALLVSAFVALVVAVALYVWYALALSRVLPKLGSPGWKGAVPFVNEAEILHLGGFPRWTVVALVVPVVSVFGVVLRAIAAHRLGRRLGRGAGATVLAVLLPPVWASLLAWGRARESTVAPAVEEWRRDPAQFVETAPVPIVAAPPPPFTPPAPITAPAAPLPPTGIQAPPWVAPPAEPAAAPMAPLIAPVSSSAPGVAADPRAAGSRFAPPGSAAPAPSALDPEPEPDADGAAPLAPLPDVDEDGETVVVDRRPVIEWELVLDEGPSHAITATSVVLGRRPPGVDPALQYLAVADTTRTLSKVHARLDRVGDDWRIIDLGSTNGVLVVEEDGAETVVSAGADAVLAGRRFLLGRVAMRLRRTGAGS